MSGHPGEPGDAPPGLHAALGDSVLSYLESLPPKQQLLTLLILKGSEGFPVEQLLAAEDDPNALLSAAEELAQEGKLARREHPDGRVFWAYLGSPPGERPETHPRPDLGTADKRRVPARSRPDRANDGGPGTGGWGM